MVNLTQRSTPHTAMEVQEANTCLPMAAAKAGTLTLLSREAPTGGADMPTIIQQNANRD